MIVTLGLTLVFRKSDNLAAAFGIAVSATMLMTSVLLFLAMRQRLHWSLPLSAAVAGSFMVMDSAFLLANSMKIAEGGYVPLALAALIYGAMWVWHSGREAVTAAVTEKQPSLQALFRELEQQNVPRVRGTAIFLTRSNKGVPPVMAWHLQHNRSLHDKVMIVNVIIEPVPWVGPEERLTFTQEAANFWRATAHFGFMERPDIPAVLSGAKGKGCSLTLDDVTYYLGHETVVPREDGKGLPRWHVGLFSIMDRNSARVTDFFKLPVNDVVEIGREVAI
jgi:KUP system potassium uptake protein